ncbi:MAG: hypothetical protein COB07_12050 [Sulfurovum sp.]|nr:MAG: hypothetical protein COB07_12050 [Sulfurovum sp.]
MLPIFQTSKNTIIYGVFEEDVLLYAIELKGTKIIQALGRFNKNIEPEPRKKIDRWLREVYLNNGISK